MKAIILAGGKGTRLAPYTYVLPKPLMPLGEKPILQYLLESLKEAGIIDVILAVSNSSYNLLSAYFQKGEKVGINISYSIEDIPLGTAGPLSKIPDLTETFLVLNGDILSNISYNEFIEYHKKSGGISTIAMKNRELNVDLGVIQLDDSNQIVGYLEKPSFKYPVSMGIYAFEPQVLDYVPHNQYFDFPELVEKLLLSNEKVMAYEFIGYWRDLGMFDDFEQANQEIREKPDLLVQKK